MTGLFAIALYVSEIALFMLVDHQLAWLSRDTQDASLRALS
jgi:hypothetical protein